MLGVERITSKTSPKVTVTELPEEEVEALESEENRTGECVVCGGEVSGIEQEYRTGPTRFGPGTSQDSIVFRDYRCERCGLKYDFLPPKDLVLSLRQKK